MKILVIGSGGREHAIAHAVSKSSQVLKIVVCPGNPGMARALPGLICKNISATDVEALLAFALLEKFDLTIVGPEASLSAGLVDEFQKNGLVILGPTKAASALESSKAFAKKMMKMASVPTAPYAEFFEVEAALSYISRHPNAQMVVKCDGLAQGKGVIVCQNKNEATNAVRALMLDKFLGENVDHIIIEDFLEGVEVSAFALCDGETFSFLGTACDHKRLRDGDAGPNTGGMGTFSPARVFNSEDQLWLEEKIFSPMLTVMKNEGIPFFGFLFAGLMKTKDRGWQVLEFNVRLGDPETQVLLPLIEEDLVPWLMAAARGEIKKFQDASRKLAPLKKNLHGVHVVMAAHGYPGTEGTKVRSGDEIFFAKDFCLGKEDYLYFAGVEMKENHFFTKGGRVLGMTSLAKSAEEARAQAYEKIESIHFEGAQYRRDIGARIE